VKLQGFVLEALENLRRLHSPLTEPKLQSTHDLIFFSDSGAPLRQRTVKRKFHRLLKAAGIRSIRLYSLRHTTATIAVAAGVSVKVISEQPHASNSFCWSDMLMCFPAFKMRQLYESNGC
jgi:site-specific recombinase XerD